ncbi:E3 ubiquitin-protein ligase RNF216 [Histoplasma ohiense]|nr:E3 ubiquitin-protein ligase RNF216 [Histoplasma ohiense (nom. inval.)]
MKRKLPIIDLTGNGEKETKVPRLSDCTSLPSQPRPRPTSPKNKYHDVCARVATIFPGINFEYVRQLHKRLILAYPGVDAEEALVNQIMDLGPYPQEQAPAEVENALQNVPGKPLPQASSKVTWGVDDGIIRNNSYYRASQYLLQVHFPKIPPEYIRSVLQSQKSLFAAYANLDQSESTYDLTSHPLYERRRPGMPDKLELRSNISIDPGLFRELQAAREEQQKKEEKRQRERELAELEARNEAACIAQGDIMECQCCYTDTPINRMVPCTGENIHFFCKECVRSTAKTQIGVMKYEVNCMDTSGCGAGFDRQILAEVLGKSLMNKLEQLQQRDEIAKAELEGLHDCPFCDFKAICPPVEVDREFHCQNPECKKVSCRRCGLASHIPKTCEQANDKKTPARQKVEEAMSEALIRTCPNPKCNVKMIKEDGCNKMICVKCRYAMCYVCKKNITREGYGHFGKPPNYCPLHDVKTNVRHFEEVSSAHKKAIEEVMKADPQLRLEELAIEAPKIELQKTSAPVGQAQIRNRHHRNNALARHGRIPGVAPFHPAQPGAAGLGVNAQVPIHAPVNRNHPVPEAYPQPVPVQDMANQLGPFGGVVERTNRAEHLQPIAQHYFEPQIWNQGGNFHFVAPAAAPQVPFYPPLQYDPNFQPHNDYRHHHHGYPLQARHSGEKPPIARQQPRPAQQPQNQNQLTHQAEQHPQHQPQFGNLQGQPQFQIHHHPRNLQPAHVTPVLAANPFGKNSVSGPSLRGNQQPNKSPVVGGGAPGKIHPCKPVVQAEPFVRLNPPAHMQAGPFVARHVISNNHQHLNVNNNHIHHNKPTFRYPVDIPDATPRRFPRN